MKKRMPGLAIAVLAGLLGCTQQPSPLPPATARNPGAFSPQATAVLRASGNGFDFYLLNLSWSPEYCYSHKSAAECTQHAAFVMHGLWPERTDGTYPENCSNAPGPSNPGQYADIYPDAGLLQHEWKTHGTCSGLSPDSFFSAARAAFHSVVPPPKLTDLEAPTSLSPDQIAELFQQSNPELSPSNITISCGNNYLTAVEVCLDKGLHPVACGSLKACRATTIRIPNP